MLSSVVQCRSRRSQRLESRLEAIHEIPRSPDAKRRPNAKLELMKKIWNEQLVKIDAKTVKSLRESVLDIDV